jgi:4-hydroxy-3-methylbut-2-enyl diphosphate reductase
MPADRESLFVVLAFDANNRLAVRRSISGFGLVFTGPDLAGAMAALAGVLPGALEPREACAASDSGTSYRIHFTQATGALLDPSIVFLALDSLQAPGNRLDPALSAVLSAIEPHLIAVPYLHLGETDFIYKFRPERERNSSIYAQDEAAETLYQSRLCSAIKALARRQERTAADPVPLDFGQVRYVIPSHFGFCLGVKNAIERAYETLAENPGRRVFMLSELIHNPFVNEDLLRRGLRYLQTDKGLPYAADGRVAAAPGGGGTPLLWDTLTPDDVVIVPAFGATDEDKRRLVRKGLGICQYDATCMLVEKVWKAARTYGRDGYTVVIHGKHEHEETKATFSNTRRWAPAVIVRNIEEARRLGEFITSPDPAVRAGFYEAFAGKYTAGFDVDRDLERVAVVNQTTLLVNETRAIIEHLRETYARRFGPDPKGGPARVGGGGRNDTLCYATQVNQDALGRALGADLDAAFVVGGKNSSNTYQLFRLCEQRLGDRAFFIQNETAIVEPGVVEHYVFPAAAGNGHHGRLVRRPLWPEGSQARPRRVLVTGGASCPDGVIQQVITRINSLFPEGALRSADEVLRELEAAASD